MDGENKEVLKIEGASHWVLEDHDKIQVAIFKIITTTWTLAPNVGVECIWVRKKIKLGYKRGKNYEIPMTNMIQGKSIFPGGPMWRPVGDLEDLFLELNDEE